MQPQDATGRPSASQPRAIRWIMLLLLLASCAALRLVCLTWKPFWFDECFSVEVARIGWIHFLRLLWWREANMSLYYLLLRAWLNFGQSEFYIRGFSVFISVATLPAIYWLARLLYDRRVALVGAALFAFNAYSVRYAQEARSYALFLLLATLASAFLVRLLREPRRRNWLGYVACSTLAVYAHLYALLLVVAHWLAVRQFLSDKHSDRSTNLLSEQLRRAWFTIGVAVLPLLIFVAKTGAGPIRWIPRPGIRDVLVFYQHLSAGGWSLLALYALAIMAALMPYRKRLFARIQEPDVWRAQFLLIWLFFPVLLTVVLSFARPVFLGRYMIFCLPALLILVSAGLTRIRQAWLLGIALGAILLLNLRGVQFVYGHDFDNERDASGAATSFILDHAMAGDAIIFHIAETRIPYEFFRSVRAGVNTASPAFTGELGPEIVFPRHASGLDYRDFTGKPTPELLRTTGAQHPRLWVMLMNNGTPEKPDPTTTMLTGVLPESFPKVQRWAFPKVEVRLYSKE